MSTIVKEMLKDYYNLDTSTILDLDRAITILVENGAFSSEELIVLKLVTDGTPTKEIAKTLNETVSNVNYRLIRISGLIADTLGAEYQDEKLLKEVEARLGRPLTPEEELFCQRVIKAGHPLRRGLTIFNFKVGKHGRITKRDEDKAEGQMDVQALWEEI